MENTKKNEITVESVSKSLSLKLVEDSIVTPKDLTVLDQKIIIRDLLNYNGNYFLDSNNECKIRCFNKTPNLIAIICEHTLDTTISDVKDAENFLRDYLTDQGFIVIHN